MTANERLEALRVIERHLTMNRQERRQAGISTPRRIIEAARDELQPYVEHKASTTEALPRDAYTFRALEAEGTLEAEPMRAANVCD